MSHGGAFYEIQAARSVHGPSPCQYGGASGGASAKNDRIWDEMGGPASPCPPTKGNPANSAGEACPYETEDSTSK